MIHVWSELLVYVIKFLSMLVCAGLGIMVGKKIRKNKDVKNIVPNLNLDILGFVDDPYKILSQSKALISPLFTGAGIKVKVIEALACGIPVIGTDIAFEGLPPLFNSFMLIAETPKDYIRCMECLNLNIDERIKTKEMFIKTYQSDSITNYIKRI